MDNTAERMKKFIEVQRQIQKAEDVSLDAWKKKVPSLAKIAEAVMYALRAATGELMFVEARSDQILVYFGTRARHFAAGAEVMKDKPMEAEGGAMAMFMATGEERRVVGLRYPFHLEKRITPQLEQFCDLGKPEDLSEEAFANAVADFLEWGSVGAGRGSRKVRFHTPS